MSASNRDHPPHPPPFLYDFTVGGDYVWVERNGWEDKPTMSVLRKALLGWPAQLARRQAPAFFSAHRVR